MTIKRRKAALASRVASEQGQEAARKRRKLGAPGARGQLMKIAKIIVKEAQTKASKAKIKNKEQEVKKSKAKARARRQAKSPYSKGQRILTIGDGNFSFSSALVKLFGSGAGIVATCLDSEAELHAKYPEAREFVAGIEESAGRVILQVDCRNLNQIPSLHSNTFDRIIWNFPHTGSGISDKARNIREQQALLSAFFASAAPLLTADGEIHVTVKRGKPYDEWAVPKVAAASSAALVLATGLQFYPHLYPGYAHRRTGGRLTEEENEDLDIGATTYVFKRPTAVTTVAEFVPEVSTE